MQINGIAVCGLFNRFDHNLEFKPDERIMIMIGPNGFGKTMTLRIIDAIFNQQVHRLAGMPFQKVVVSFDDGSRLKVSRQEQEVREKPSPSHSKLEMTFQNAAGKQESFVPEPRTRPDELSFPVGMIEEMIPVLDQIGLRRWRHRHTGEMLGIDEVLERFEDELPRSGAALPPQSPQWLQEIRQSIPVRLIDTERLTRPLLQQRNRALRVPGYNPQVFTERTVRQYAEELGKRVQQTLTDYGALSQSLDRTFPVRLVEEPSQPELTLDMLRSGLAEIEAKRSRLVEAGLLAQEQTGLSIPALEKVDETRRGVLAVYARDAKEKLRVFDDLYARVDALQRIANSRLLYKRVTVGSNGLGVVTSDGAQLELEMLSSGEQHELVILYDLLFRVPGNSLILIDEPELSLHVVWQEQFLNDLEEMAQLSKFRAILATHSPQLIGDRWDLTVELKGPNGA